MFAYRLSSKENPLATVWLAANLDKKLTKAQLIHTNISKTAKAIINSDSSVNENNDDLSSLTGSELETREVLIASEPIALRLSGQLLYGIVKIYSRKERYLLEDVSDVLVKLKSIFKSNNLQSIIVPASKTMMNINRSILYDTVNEANIFNELLDPLNIDIDIDDLLNDNDKVFNNMDYSIEAGRDVRANLSTLVGNSDVRSSRNKRKHSQMIQEHNKNEMNNFRTLNDGQNKAHLDDMLDFGNSNLDNLNNDNDNDNEIPDTGQELVLEFEKDDTTIHQGNISKSIEIGRDLMVETSKFDNNNEPTFNFGNLFNNKLSDITYEETTANREMVMSHNQNYDAAAAEVLDPNTGLVDTRILDKDAEQENSRMHGVETTEDLNPVFELGPLETVEESKQEQQQIERSTGIGEEYPRTKRQRKGSRVNKFGGKKKIMKDNTIEFTNDVFQSHRFSEAENSKLADKKKLMRDVLSEKRKLFYLKKFSNAANFFIETNQFKDMWNVRSKAINSELILKQETGIYSKNLDTNADANIDESHLEIEMNTELPTHYQDDSGFDFNLDFADNFDSGFVDRIDVRGNNVPDVPASDEEQDNNETFFHRESADDFTSSLADTSSNTRNNLIMPDEEHENTNELTSADDISSQMSQYNLPGNQLEDETNNGSSISKSTLKIADILKDEFVVGIKKNITLNTVIEIDQATKAPLSKTLKKQAARCLFELLVLATKDTITLRQDSLFGKISVTPKDNLYIL